MASVLTVSYWYESLGSNPFNPSKGLALDIRTLPCLSSVGIHITVSPSKSAPDNCSATLELIPIASWGLVPNIDLACFCLLLTVSTGISNIPPWGYRTNANLVPSWKFGAYTSVSFIVGIAVSTWYLCPGKAAACKWTAAESHSLANLLNKYFLTVGFVKAIISAYSWALVSLAKFNCFSAMLIDCLAKNWEGTEFFHSSQSPSTAR